MDNSKIYLLVRNSSKSNAWKSLIPAATLGNNNYVAPFLMLLFFFALALSFLLKSIWKIRVARFCTIFFPFGLMLTSCRAAVLGLGVGCFFLFLKLRASGNENRPSWKLAVSVVVLALAIVFAITRFTPQSIIGNKLLLLERKLTSVLKPSGYLGVTIFTRVLAWKVSLNKTFESPSSFFLGFGFGSFKHAFPYVAASFFSDEEKEQVDSIVIFFSS